MSRDKQVAQPPASGNTNAPGQQPPEHPTQPQGLANSADQANADGKKVMLPGPATMPPTPLGMHAESMVVDAEGYFIDTDGKRIKAQDGEHVHRDDRFTAQATKPEGYWKAGQKFGIVPSEVVFKSLSAAQQRAFLEARGEALIVQRKARVSDKDKPQG